MLTKNKIIEDLKNLGIKEGDIIFVTIDILKVGYFNLSREQTLIDWVEIFKNVIGQNGGVVFAAYTKLFFRFKKRNLFFHRFVNTYTGSLPNYIISDINAIRSKHPSNSVVGYGENLKPIFEKHNQNSLSYSILGDLIKMPNTKFIMIGTIDKKNAPQSMHYIQEELGLTKFSPFKYLMQIYYFENNIIKKYTKIDFGGCSRGGYKLFAPLLINDAVKFSKVGKSLSACMPAKKSYLVIKEEILKNKKLVQCDDFNCIDCYGNPVYNGFGVFPFYFKLLFNFKTLVLDRLRKALY